ncbi:Aconitase/3-isopropylmalate dehydratase [Aspergillus spectabilis]
MLSIRLTKSLNTTSNAVLGNLPIARFHSLCPIEKDLVDLNTTGSQKPVISCLIQIAVYLCRYWFIVPWFHTHDFTITQPSPAVGAKRKGENALIAIIAKPGTGWHSQRTTRRGSCCAQQLVRPCVGSWDRKDVDVRGKEKNLVVSSFNRNFVGRHDSNPATHSFVTSPELVTAFAYTGRLDFNPLTDAVTVHGDAKKTLRFSPPVNHELPARFQAGQNNFQAPSLDGNELSVAIRPGSDRLQLLQPFYPWQQGCADRMELLIKVKGKCTTDHISPAGPWYKYRGHLENISNNMLTTATNAFLGAEDAQLLGHTRHPINSDVQVVPEVARDLKRRGVRWCIVRDTTMVKAALASMQPWSPDPATYDRIAEGDRIALLGVEDGELSPASQITMRIEPQGGQAWEAQLNHSYHRGQISWLRAGSALNHIKATVLTQ